jgi:hypothetical protein
MRRFLMMAMTLLLSSQQATASAPALVNLFDPLVSPMSPHARQVFRTELCKDAQELLAQTPPLTTEQQAWLKARRAEMPPVGTPGYDRGLAAISDTWEVSIETVHNRSQNLVDECWAFDAGKKTTRDELAFWVHAVAGLSDSTIDQCMTQLQGKGLDLRRPYQERTAIAVGRQIILEQIIRRIISPMIDDRLYE